MSLTGIAALIAAVSFAVLAGAGVYLAVRFTRVLGDAATLVRDTRSDQQALFARANTAVDRANAQLDLTEAATASVGTATTFEQDWLWYAIDFPKDLTPRTTKRRRDFLIL